MQKRLFFESQNEEKKLGGDIKKTFFETKEKLLG